MLVNLTQGIINFYLSRPVVIFINILQAPITHIFLHQKISKPKPNWRKALQSTFERKKIARKMFVNLTAGALI